MLARESETRFPHTVQLAAGTRVTLRPDGLVQIGAQESTAVVIPHIEPAAAAGVATALLRCETPRATQGLLDALASAVSPAFAIGLLDELLRTPLLIPASVGPAKSRSALVPPQAVIASGDIASQLSDIFPTVPCHPPRLLGFPPAAAAPVTPVHTGTFDATGSAGATGATDSKDSRDSRDSRDSTGATDTADATDATDAVDGIDGIDAVDGIDASSTIPPAYILGTDYPPPELLAALPHPYLCVSVRDGAIVVGPAVVPAGLDSLAGWRSWECSEAGAISTDAEAGCPLCAHLGAPGNTPWSTLSRQHLTSPTIDFHTARVFRSLVAMQWHVFTEWLALPSLPTPQTIGARISINPRKLTHTRDRIPRHPDCPLCSRK